MKRRPMDVAEGCLLRSRVRSDPSRPKQAAPSTCEAVTVCPPFVSHGSTSKYPFVVMMRRGPKGFQGVSAFGVGQLELLRARGRAHDPCGLMKIRVDEEVAGL